MVPRWPDHGQRMPGAAATAPDQGTGQFVRQGEGWRRCPDRGRGLSHGSGQGFLTGASGAPGRMPGLQGFTGHAPRPVVWGVPGHRGATDDQSPVSLPDRGSRGAGGRFAGLGADLGPVPRWWPWCPAGRIMAKGCPEPPPRPRIRAQGSPSGKVRGGSAARGRGRGEVFEGEKQGKQRRMQGVL